MATFAVPRFEGLLRLFYSERHNMSFETRYVKLRVAHAAGMPETFSLPPRVSDTGMHHGMCVTHVPWCMPGSLTSGFLWSWWRRKRSRHSRRMRNPQFYVSGKRSMTLKLFRHYYPFVQGIHWSPTFLLNKGKYCWTNVFLVDGLNRLLKQQQITGDMRRHDAHVTLLECVCTKQSFICSMYM